MNRILSSEIISLVHHVKLNESGWWEKSIQNIIISTFGINKNAPQKESDIFRNLELELNSNFDKNRIASQIDKLKSKQQLVKATEGLFILSEDVYEEFQASLLKQKEIEFEAEKRFRQLCQNIFPDYSSEDLWSELNQHLVIPLIREIGAKTYELISGKDTISIDQYGQFQKFVNRFNENRSLVQVLLLEYFDFKNLFVKAYILHQLNAYFFVESANLSNDAVEEVYSLSKSQTNLKIFVDTNFLLTLLDLHDNPSNEAAFSLIELIDEIKNKVKVKFYILPVTVLEFQNLIHRFKDHLKRIRPTLNQAIAAENTDDFSGIVKRYFQKCHEKHTMLNLDDYFDPYLDNFTVTIRTKGLEIQQDNMDSYSKDQRVVDDLLEQVEYRFERNLKSNKYQGLSEDDKESKRQNIYDKFNHDCKLWHYVKDKRPTYIDSPKDVKNWILTLDFGFLEYDKFKQLNNAHTKISVCLHPNEFISMLQFWVPRTPKFENAILGNFRLPFLFREVDTGSEKVSMEILRAISQYEDSEQFDSELVTEILTNKALRQKIKVSNSVEENAELIKEELFKKYEIAKKLLKEKTANNENLSGELGQVKSEIGVLNRKLDEYKDETNKKIELELDLARRNRVQAIQTKQESLQLKKRQLKSRLDDFEEQKRKAEIQYQNASRGFKALWNSALTGREKYLRDLKKTIHNEYYNVSKYGTVLEEFERTSSELEKLTVPSFDEQIIIYCENQNSDYFNRLNFDSIYFVPEKDSNGVFIKTIANEAHYGIRDRDFLTDNEIDRITKAHPNYIILEYYCFENYLYHPDNIAEVQGQEFDRDLYIEKLVNQKNSKYDSIVLKLKNARNGYQEFKKPDNRFRENDEVICSYLKSDDIEQFLKSFSLKSEFDKEIISKEGLRQEVLSSTDWFRNRINNLLTGKFYSEKS